MPAFIETQFPISRLSAESYKERKAGASQTLTGLGKWWGRKPLILVRASIIGMLMPASDNPQKDLEIFLKILTMDDAGAWQRYGGDIPDKEWLKIAPPELKAEFFSKRAFKKGLSEEEKEEITDQIWDALDVEQQAYLETRRNRKIKDPSEFKALPYAERIRFCKRPENIEGPSPRAWDEINSHLGTNATSLPELVEQLGQRQFGHTPRVGDCFCGGGSIPFEAARIGCEAFGSDLNPVAALLTWASLNLLGGGEKVQNEVRKAQETVFAAADKQVTEWGIEHNDRGERAEAYLYCVEVKPEGCDYYIPLAPSWVISEKYRIVATWDRLPGNDRLQPMVQAVSEDDLKLYKGDLKLKKEKKGATVVDSRVIDPFDANRSWSMESLRGPEGLRRWTNDDVVPRSGDVFQERLYCIRWIDGDGKRRYAAPDAADLAREAKVLELLRERFVAWQREGFIPSKAIPEGGDKTEEPIRTRGWTHWHHLFTPRQLLVAGILGSNVTKKNTFIMPRIGNLADFNSRLTRYPSTRETINNTFSNQALNTIFNYPCRALILCKNVFVLQSDVKEIKSLRSAIIKQADARDINDQCNIWITDPPYADAINYHELSDFFLAWYEKQLTKAFPEWIPDSRAELAVRGDGDNFRRSMVEIYRNMARHMPDNGMQMVMFTHQNPAVWADLGMILWAAGLKATAAWTISTETKAAGIRKGNYVQGTVCLVLRKRSDAEEGFKDEIIPQVENEVRRQIDSMRSLDRDMAEPNFNDADYQLAAYAAALKVLTRYSSIEGRDVEHEVFAERETGKVSDFQEVIERALSLACGYLIPKGLEKTHWESLSLVERYYLRSLDIESRGERRQGMYEELARGFGVKEIRPLLKNDKPNGARMHTATGFGKTLLAEAEGAGRGGGLRRGRAAIKGPHPFAGSDLRHLLFAIRETVANDNSPEPGRNYLRGTLGSHYWEKRNRLLVLLDWLARLGDVKDMAEWQSDSAAAQLLAGRLRNDEA